MTSSFSLPDPAGTATNSHVICFDQAAGRPMEQRVEEAAKLIWSFCKPLLDFLGAGEKPPAGDMISIMQDCLLEAERRVPGCVGTWRLAAGRITTAQSRKSIYKKGQWLQSEDGGIVDMNRYDLEAGCRYTQADDSPIAEYRHEPGKCRIKTSPLLPIWRGETASPAGFHTDGEVRISYDTFKLTVARALSGV